MSQIDFFELLHHAVKVITYQRVPYTQCDLCGQTVNLFENKTRTETVPYSQYLV